MCIYHGGPHLLQFFEPESGSSRLFNSFSHHISIDAFFKEQ